MSRRAPSTPARAPRSWRAFIRWGGLLLAAILLAIAAHHWGPRIEIAVQVHRRGIFWGLGTLLVTLAILAFAVAIGTILRCREKDRP